MQSVFSSHDGVEIAFHTAGSGSPQLVFIPGLTGDHSDFAAQIEHFRTDHLVVAIELPGNGVSGTDRSEWSMASFGSDVATVVEHLDLDEVVLVGHSLGGDVAVEAALLLEERVRGVVMISSYRSLGHPRSQLDDAAWLAPFRSDFTNAMESLTRRNFGANADPSIVEATVRRMVDAQPDMVIAVLEAKVANEPALLSALAKLEVSVFAVNPDFKPNDQSSLEQHGVTLKVVQSAGHYTMMENPGAFNAALARILRELH